MIEDSELQIKTLTSENETLKAEIAEMNVQMKRADEDRLLLPLQHARLRLLRRLAAIAIKVQLDAFVRVTNQGAISNS